jgi:LmbE family N-acetylglucosaminyl deacetylase
MIVDPSKHLVPSATHAQVLKLHGSVDWQRRVGGHGARYSITESPEYALMCRGEEIGIATPGPTKKIAANELKVLWTAAVERVEAAEVIVFVGFRFPPTDAEAREKLLGALSETTSTHVELHIVLGPDRGHPDVVRLEQLLRYAMGKARRYDLDNRRFERLSLGSHERTFGLTVHPLFAEDFFTVWRREVLWPDGLTILPPATSA